MNEVALRAKRDELWEQLQTFSLDDRNSLLCFLMGYCVDDEQFLKGVESGINDLKLGGG